MFFILADYIQKNVSDIFKKVKLSSIMPIYDTDDSYYYSDYDSDYDSDSIPLNDAIKFPLVKNKQDITILCRFSTQEELDDLV